MSNGEIKQVFARDKDGKKIGRIIREKSTIKEITVSSTGIFSSPIEVVFKKANVLKVDVESIWFKVTKIEFNLFVKQKRAQIKQQIKAAKFGESSSINKAVATNFWGKL
ncbi:MAG: hypothetical protein FK734_18435 [Asgard group archaeon]|nr:hypothetical protein [Asgard group archaeon]